MSTLRTNEVEMLDGRGKGAITFDNVEEMQDSTAINVGQKVRTLGYYAPGDGGGSDYEIVASGTGSNYGFLYEQLAGSGLEARLLGGGIMEDKTVFIPTDYGTLQEAIDGLSKLRIAQGVTINLMIEMGYEVPEGIGFDGGDYSHFSISSQDAKVPVSISFPASSNLLTISNAQGPRVNCLFDMKQLGVDGFNLSRRSSLSVAEGAGVENSGRTGAYIVHASTLSAPGSIFRFSKGRNVECTSGSKANVQNSDLRGGNIDAIYYGSCYARRASEINAQGSDFSDTEGIACGANRGSVFNAMSSTFSNVTGSCAFAQSGGVVIIDSSTIDNCGRVATAEWGGKSVANNLNATNITFTGLRAVDGGEIIAHNITMSGSVGNESPAIDANIGSSIICPSSVISGFDNPISCTNGSVVKVNFSDISEGFASKSSILSGSFIHANNCTTKNSESPGSPSTTDFNVSSFNALFSLGIVWA